MNDNSDGLIALGAQGLGGEGLGRAAGVVW